MLLHLSVILFTGGGRCTPPWADTPETATAADGTHPTGMPSCSCKKYTDLHQQIIVFRSIDTRSVFSLTLARSPIASRSYRRASDFLNYSPGLASDILVEWEGEKKKNFF